MQRSLRRLFQSGVHTAKGAGVYSNAKIKNWPEQKIPDDFRFTDEQRFRLKAMPRDIGRIPRDFVLSVVYQNQPCEVDKLWDMCSTDPRCVLDSKRHLRAVLKQAREEGWITFEKSQDVAASESQWTCVLTRERFSEVKQIISGHVEASATSGVGLRGANLAETTEALQAFKEMNEDAKATHLRLLKEQVKLTTERLRRFQRTEVDYLPYTDLNGKVQFMWWYETRDQTAPASETLPESDNAVQPTS